MKKHKICVVTDTQTEYSLLYWLNAIILNGRAQRDEFLEYCHNNRVMVRPVWTLMNKLPMYQHCQHTNLETAQWLEDRLVNIPSSVRV